MIRQNIMCGITALPANRSSSCYIEYRGPDNTIVCKAGLYRLYFHRLAVMDTSSNGNQPFSSDHYVVMCNGEIYNYMELKQQTDYEYKSNSDCEIILALLECGKSIHEICNLLDGEFAFVVYDLKKDLLYAGRDHLGVRPLFFGFCQNDSDQASKIAFSSEMKELIDHCIGNGKGKIEQMKPGHYFDGTQFVLWNTDLLVLNNQVDDLIILENIRSKLINAVEKRLVADIPIGFLLSGGLDSSLVTAIAADSLRERCANAAPALIAGKGLSEMDATDKLPLVPIETFAIGFEHNPIDCKYARIVAEHLQQIGIEINHHEIIFTRDDVTAILNKVIWHTETWDITTIRASVPMFLLCKYIKEHTNVRVLLTGEVSDELFGYKYTDFAPNAEEWQQEAIKRVDELHMYDLLRADRCIAGNGIECRVPFSDKDFVDYVMGINPELKMTRVPSGTELSSDSNRKNGIGKYLLRAAFADDHLLPTSILWRDKSALSDGVGHAFVDCLHSIAKERQYGSEAEMYWSIFASYFPGQSHVIPDCWMPNRTWSGCCDVTDPSARYLSNYTESQTV